MLFSSDTHIVSNPDVLETRFIDRGIPVKYFHQFIFRDAFSPFGVEYVRQRLSETKSVNSDFQPSAYLYNLMLWAEIHGGKALHQLLHMKGWHVFTAIIISVLLSIPFLFGRRKGIVAFSVFTTGFSGMSFMLTAILAYQSLHGYVYEMIGILSASFMIGLWAGTGVTRSLRKPLVILFLLDMLIILLAALSVLFFREELITFLVVFGAGLTCGAQFSTANLSIGESTVGGRLYAFDLFGSFIGALTSSLLVIPLFGLTSALLLVSVIKASSAIMILSLRPFHIN